MAFIRYLTAAQRIERGFRVTVPDFPGVAATGDTMGEAMAAAEAALAKRIAAMIADGLTVPEPSMMSDVQDDPEYSGNTFGLIMADASLWRPEVVN